MLVSFTSQSTGSITSHAWDFGDGGTSTLSSPNHTYAFAGTYTVSLTETGPGGSSTRTRTGYITVERRGKLASGSPAGGVPPVALPLTSQPPGPVASPARYVGDGSTSASPSHVVRAHASATARNGSGVNAPVYTGSAPVLGQTWTATIETSAHEGAGLTFILFRAAPPAGIPPASGEVLIDPSSARLFRSIALASGGIATHAVPIPDQLALQGFQVATRGLILGERSRARERGRPGPRFLRLASRFAMQGARR